MLIDSELERMVRVIAAGSINHQPQCDVQPMVRRILKSPNDLSSTWMLDRRMGKSKRDDGSVLAFFGLFRRTNHWLAFFRATASPRAGKIVVGESLGLCGSRRCCRSRLGLFLLFRFGFAGSFGYLLRPCAKSRRQKYRPNRNHKEWKYLFQ